MRRGLHLATYNAYQSIIRGGHILLTMRISDEAVYSHGDKLDLLLCCAIMGGATYVARGYSGDLKHLTGLIKGGILHKGFALIDVFSPCVTFNLDNTHAFFKSRVAKLEQGGHDKSDWKTACEQAMMWGETIYIGLFFETDARDTPVDLDPVLSEGGPLARRPLGLTKEQARWMLQRMS